MSDQNINLPNAIIYKYNKYIQINGSLFYAFDYLIEICKKEKDKTMDKTFWYIIISSKFKKDYLLKLRYLFRTKYPLWSTRFTRDKNFLELAKKVLKEKDYNELLEKIELVNEAFSRIKLVIPTQILKCKFNKVLYPSYNTWIDTHNLIDTKESLVFQNRKITSLEKIELPENILNKNKTTFYYELDSQKPNRLAQNQFMENYILKLNIASMVPNQIFKAFPKTEFIIAGKPIVNTNINFNIHQKPSMFSQLPKNNNFGLYEYNEPKFFLNTKRIDYYQNFLRYDENNRILIEARYFNIPIRIMDNDSLRDINNLPANINNSNLEPDSSISRLKNDINLYLLNEEDIIINQF